MNNKLGRIGMQEAASLAAIAACASGIFTPDGSLLYPNGNSAYLSMLISAGLSLFVFWMLSRVMSSTGCHSYYELLRLGLGASVGGAAAVLTGLLCVLAAASLVDRFLIMLGRFIFPLAKNWEMLLYILTAIILLAWLGLEGLGRTARLFLPVLALAIMVALIISSGGYEVYRLAPVLGDGTLNMLSNSLVDMYLFLPSLMGLLIVSRGVHGVVFAKKAGYAAGCAGGLLSAVCQVCMGMTYPYNDLALMHSPMYKLTADFKLSAYFPELDTLLVFGWMIGAVIAAAFYIYAASLLYAQTFRHADVRPPILAFCALTGGMALSSRQASTEHGLALIRRMGFILLLSPALIAAVSSLIRKAGTRHD